MSNQPKIIVRYEDQEDLKIAHALQKFPRQYPDDYCYEYGSEDPNKNYGTYFKMRIYTPNV